jgi:flagellar hook-length control protein FliK
MEWSVNERDARRNKEGGRERGWDTTLQINLPKLGTVSARLKLDGDRVSIDIRTGQAESAAVLAAGRPELFEQLEAAGLTAGEIGIKHDTP